MFGFIKRFVKQRELINQRDRMEGYVKHWEKLLYRDLERIERYDNIIDWHELDYSRLRKSKEDHAVELIGRIDYAKVHSIPSINKEIEDFNNECGDMAETMVSLYGEDKIK